MMGSSAVSLVDEKRFMQQYSARSRPDTGDMAEVSVVETLKKAEAGYCVY